MIWRAHIIYKDKKWVLAENYSALKLDEVPWTKCPICKKEKPVEVFK